MKRKEFQTFIENKNNLKKLCSEHFEKFKDKHKGEWEYNKKLDAFIDEYDEVVAYRYDGILYYVEFNNKKHVPVNLKDIDTPSIPKDVWYLILSRISYIPHIIPFLDCCVASAKSASLVIRERGDKLLDTYGTQLPLSFAEWRLIT